MALYATGVTQQLIFHHRDQILHRCGQPAKQGHEGFVFGDYDDIL